MSAPKVILANDDVLARDILRHACAVGRVTVVAEADTIDGLCTAAKRFPTAVVVASNTLDETPVEEAVSSLGAGQRAIVISGDTSPARLLTLLSHPFRGYLFHDASPAEVVAGIKAVARGAAVLNPTAAAILLEQWREAQSDSTPLAWRGRPLLTPREAEVLAALADGLSTKAIAGRLKMANKTVENHKLRIFDKLGVHTQAHAVVVALRHGLVPEPAGATE
jgi:DNA-binding NarL/FixJ family response regulator